MNKKIYLALLHSIWLTQNNLFKLFEKDQNYKEIYENINQKILKDLWIADLKIKQILKEKEKINIENLKVRLENKGVEIITIYDNNYPETLKQIPNKPFLFYLRWTLPKQNCLAVVWARKITDYWVKAINEIVPILSNNFCIVSGWAAWCDSEAHKASVNSPCKTLAVLWTGIDIDYPSSNNILYNNIVNAWWWVISIFPLWTPWNNYTFPVRNEIVAWLSVWTLVIEAEEKSWSLITAKLALDMWRDLYAIPWEIFKPRSVWCNKLISAWEAKLVTCANDILWEYWLSEEKVKNKMKISFKDEIEEAIYKLLSLWSLRVDEIIKDIKIDINILNLKLSMLELSWIIRKSSSWKYEIA